MNYWAEFYALRPAAFSVQPALFSCDQIMNSSLPFVTPFGLVKRERAFREKRLPFQVCQAYNADTHGYKGLINILPIAETLLCAGIIPN